MVRFFQRLSLILIVGGLLFGGYYYYTNQKGFQKLIDTSISNLFTIINKNKMSKKVLYTFAVMSDVHSDKNYAQIALEKAKESNVTHIVITGDWTKVGTKEELFEMKKVFDASGIPYYSVPGDHDLWASGLTNFKEIFGSNYQSFDKNSTHYILLDTSNVDIGLGKEQFDWLKKDLSLNNEKKSFVFMHLPPYHPTSYRTMWEKQGDNSSVKKQADELINLLSDYGVLEVFAGDHHLSASYTEPKTGLKIRIVGAITLERNLQKPRFDIVTVYEDKTFEINEVVLSI